MRASIRRDGVGHPSVAPLRSKGGQSDRQKPRVARLVQNFACLQRAIRSVASVRQRRPAPAIAFRPEGRAVRNETAETRRSSSAGNGVPEGPRRSVARMGMNRLVTLPSRVDTPQFPPRPLARSPWSGAQQQKPVQSK